MDMELCWELFRATGEPMAYMLYREHASACEEYGQK